MIGMSGLLCRTGFSGNRNIKSLEAVHGGNHFAHAGMNGIPLAAC